VHHPELISNNMDKIKSVLHGHKKDDTVAHNAQTSPSTAEGHVFIGS
jgi:hypothetical protein